MLTQTRISHLNIFLKFITLFVSKDKRCIFERLPPARLPLKPRRNKYRQWAQRLRRCTSPATANVSFSICTINECCTVLTAASLHTQLIHFHVTWTQKWHKLCLLWVATPRRRTQKAHHGASSCAQTSACWEARGQLVWRKKSPQRSV